MSNILVDIEKMINLIRDIINLPIVDRILINTAKPSMVIFLKRIEAPTDHVFKESIIRAIKYYGFSFISFERKIVVELW